MLSVPSRPFSSYLFIVSVGHRHLRPCPARRSSDLTARTIARAMASSSVEVNSIGTAAPERAAVPIEFTSRSEEHTSELQSLRHLVCRLLLEKKKMVDIRTDGKSK